MQNVDVWVEEVIIPTYEIGEPEKNPVFLEKRVYQGSSGVVYPYPVIEKIYDEKVEKRWKAVFLENEYLKIMILPELGGRVQMAYDKVKQRHFVYYNRVIKPALVGLTGPWISGGIEFNWPQHHRPSTYQAVDYFIEENADGSKTVWCSEIERMFRTKGMAGFTLYPDKAYMEIKVKLFNRTPIPQTFLWWANPAVKVNEHYQSVFPPDVNAVFDHGKRDVSTFPIATGTYYKVDYSSGVDISMYKNIPVPTSYMAVKSGYDFIGCFENDTKGGMLHFANHHISPGKKQWTWGNGDFGYAWDRNLTDEDGPYIELMCGVYTDNQPDFSWLMPYEEKSFNQYFMPYRDLGMVKNASKDALLNMEIEGDKIKLSVYTTSRFENITIILKRDNIVVFQQQADLSPFNVFEKYLEIEGDRTSEQYEVLVLASDGENLVSWKNEIPKNNVIPEPARAAKTPEEIKHIEQLYLTGLHLEQYRHATFRASDYYLEALRRDPGDARCNNAMGLLEMKNGKFKLAGEYFSKTINTLTERNPNPYDGEAFFNYGLSLRYQYQEADAFDAFYKAVWNDACQAAGYFQLAEIATKKKNYSEALDLIDRSLLKQWHNHKARHLQAAVLRLLGKKDNALHLITASLKIDRFNIGCIYEKYLLTGDKVIIEDIRNLTRGNIHTFIEIALDYAWAGLFENAISLLERGIEFQSGQVYPIAWYYLGWFSFLLGDEPQAVIYYEKAETEEPGTCFPNQLESVLALENCILLMKKPVMASYYLGNFYYHKRQYDKAIELWEKASENEPCIPTVHRNLALAYYNKAEKKEEALRELEKAFELDSSDSRIFMELDALYKRLNKDYFFRLNRLERYIELTDFRDDLYLERVTLLNFVEKYSTAYELIMKRKFHPWEGGEGKVNGQYVLSLVEMAKDDITAKEYRKSIEKLELAKRYPYNLGEGKLVINQENDLDFWLGYSYDCLGEKNLAKEYFMKASEGLCELSPAMYYNDQQPDKIFYQGLAFIKSGKIAEAKNRFNNLITYGEKHLNDKVKIDYFAVSLPDLMIWDDDLDCRNMLHCKYLIALGNMGLGNYDRANAGFDEILIHDRYHAGTFVHFKLLKTGLLDFVKS